MSYYELLVTSLPKSVAEPWLYGAVCHGLLCFEDLCGATFLFNPLTREAVLLPSDLLHERAYLDSIGIGVDRLTSLYKILRVSYSLGKDLSVHPIIRAEVLDQGSWSWRDTVSAPPDLPVGAPVYAAGSIHWSVAGGGGHIVGTLSFDLAKEEFGPTPFPELRGTRLVRLVDHRGALGLIDPSLQESVDMWVMEESGLWVRKHRIPLTLLGCVSSHQFGEFLGCGGRKMVLKHRSGLLSYDPATDELEYVQRGRELPARVVGSITVSLLSPAKLWNADKVLFF
ncbi:putative F-box protein At5g62660 [Syzygium oleosum]|uniref:putative F-box protein At5g62660 n=1 Tax=Syzygium oleosum TaxID=219896 RepID=UPI0024B9EA40|nr:putative F-box protein At5g62660 [Syzygium oleosum]